MDAAHSVDHVSEHGWRAVNVCLCFERIDVGRTSTYDSVGSDISRLIV